LELLSTAVSLLVVPLTITIAERLFGVVTDFEPKAMVTVLLATVVLPLGLGIGIARFFPRTAPGLAAVADRLGSVVLLLGAVVLLAFYGPKMLAVIGEGTVLAILVVIVFGLLFGELLGGRDRSIRSALASATVSRHPAIALLLASGAFPQQQPTIIGTVLIYLIASLLLPNLLMRWRK
jgi:BASS family bile acid:Na+ symporter